MPLARIITDVADDSLELTMQLRARGYQVETVSPGAIPSTPADLEVRLEECASEDVVLQASNGVSAEDLWVYVAPGALDSGALPIRTIPLSTTPTVDHSSTSSKILSIVTKQKNERPSVLGSLAIDSHEEDPILAELHGFPVAKVTQPPAEQLSAVIVTIPDLLPPPTVPRVVTPARVESQSPVTPQPPSASIELPPTKWLVDPEKKTPARSQSSAIPIAPEPVRATIAMPSPSIRRPARRRNRWSVQPFQAACGLAILALVGWLLILIGRPQAAATSGRAESAAVSKPAPRSANKPSVAEMAPQQHVMKPTAAKVESTVTATATTVSPSNAHDAVAKAPKVHHDDGLIAADTVVFYDGKRPGPQRAKIQPEASVKHYSDQN